MCTNERSFDDALGAAMDRPARGRIRGALWNLMHYCIKHHGSVHYGIMHYCIKHYGANALWHAAAKSTCYVQVYAQYMMCHLSKYNKSHQNLNDMSVIWSCTKSVPFSLSSYHKCPQKWHKIECMSKDWREPDSKESLRRTKSARSIRSVIGSWIKSGEHGCQKVGSTYLHVSWGTWQGCTCFESMHVKSLGFTC